MNKKLLLTLCIFLSTFYVTTAQSWQWGKRGGSIDATTSVGHQPDEKVYSMATDPDGNLYVLSIVMQTALNVDGHAIADYGDHDILLTSFKCDGTYRWSKDIGSNTTDEPVSLKTDTLGGVYVAGYLPAYTITEHIDADTSWVNTTYQFNFIAKFDTAGNYKWIRQPEPDTIGLTTSYVMDMDADNAGNTYTLWIMSRGAYAGGAFIVTTPGYYVLEYDRNGNFVSGTPRFDISYTGYYTNLRMKRDHQDGRYYLTGDILYAGPSTLSFGGTLIGHGMFIGAFSGSGALLWEREDNQSPIGFGYSFSRPAIDAQENIYVTAEAYYFSAPPVDTFNGYAIINRDGPDGNVPFVVKLDTDGNNIWAANGSATINTPSAAVAVNGSDAYITGQSGNLTWPGFADSLSTPGNVFITRFNAATGAVTGLDSLGVSGFPSGIICDKLGNFYVGGSFTAVLYVAGDTLENIGGDTDFFVAKYGSANCSCTVPTASFTSTTGSPHVTFTYTGTTGEDSVRWTFGDGGTSTTLSPAHTYTASGTYTACVTVYTSCGSDSSCETITVAHVGINVPALAAVAIYPNPASEQLVIEGTAEGTTVRLFNIMGQQVYRGMVAGNRQVVDVHSLPAGTYIIQLTDASGNRMSKSIVKQ